MAAAVGGLELAKLIKSMSPTLHDETLVFATVADGSKLLEQAISKVDMLFKESEGWTIIVNQAVADDLGIDFIFPCRKVTLNVHSSLEAVGFLAAITSRLAEKLRIGVNPVRIFLLWQLSSLRFQELMLTGAGVWLLSRSSIRTTWKGGSRGRRVEESGGRAGLRSTGWMMDKQAP